MWEPRDRCDGKRNALDCSLSKRPIVQVVGGKAVRRTEDQGAKCDGVLWFAASGKRFDVELF